MSIAKSKGRKVRDAAGDMTSAKANRSRVCDADGCGQSMVLTRSFKICDEIVIHLVCPKGHKPKHLRRHRSNLGAETTRITDCDC